jgi:hypothetical protein
MSAKKGKALVVLDAAHASLGASNAERWMTCPGSVRLSEGLPDYETVFAKEGTAAHALAEVCLSRGKDPSDFLGMSLEDVEVSEDMVEFVRTYVEHCRGIANGADFVRVEQRFSLAPLNPPGPMFGTADFVAYHAAQKRLYVRDLKYGQGVVVEVTGNKQLRYYGLGAAMAPEIAKFDIESIDIGIVQPRAQHPEGVVRSEVVPLDELIGFAGELLESARATLAPGAPLKAGKHCRFCKASGLCPEQKRVAEEVARVEFAAVPERDMPPAPETLPQALFEEILGKLDIVEDWMKAMRGHAVRRLEAGEPVHGFKLVQKRATRKWVDEAAAAQYLEAMGEKPEDLFVRELKSPAQMEKLVGKKNLPNQFIEARSSGTSMVGEDDPRPAVTPGSEFAAIPAAT